MLPLLVTLAFAAEPNIEAASTGDPVEVLLIDGKTPTPLCTTPCSLTLAPDATHRLIFKSEGHPDAQKRLRLATGEHMGLKIKPGKNGLATTGGVMAGIGVIGLTVGSIILAVDSSQPSVLMSSATLILVSVPFQIAGATKVKKRSRR